MASKRDKRQRQSNTNQLKQYTGKTQEPRQFPGNPKSLHQRFSFKYSHRPAKLDPVDWRQYGRGKFINNDGEWQAA